MSQVKLQDIKARLKVLNDMIAHSNVQLHHERRYNYNALDLYQDQNVLNTLATGMTRKELYERINAMIDGIDLYTKEKPIYR